MAAPSIEPTVSLGPEEHSARRLRWEPPLTEVIFSSRQLRNDLRAGHIRRTLQHMRIHRLPLRHLFGHHPMTTIDGEPLPTSMAGRSTRAHHGENA